MSNPRIIIAGIFFLIMGMGCKTQQPIRVQHIRNLEAGHKLQGFYYALPRTVLSIDIKVVKTEETPGPFAQYASRFLSLENVITAPSTIFEIRNVKINSFAEPDPAEFYFVELDLNKNRKNPFSLHISESGLISAVNAPFDEQMFLMSMPEARKYGYFGTEATFNYFLESGLQEKVDTIIQYIQVDTMTVERRNLRRRMVEKSSEIRAREVADYIMKLREKKFDLISGFAEIPYSKEALQFMYDQMKNQENDYLELFTGITTQTVMSYRFYYIPEKNTAGIPHTLFHFSEKEGVTNEEESGSFKVEIEAARSNITRQLGVFIMNPDRSKKADTGIFYRIPEHANITVRKGGTSLADARMLVNQYGIITSLPPTDLKIEFYPNTGSVKSVKRIK